LSNFRESNDILSEYMKQLTVKKLESKIEIRQIRQDLNNEEILTENVEESNDFLSKKTDSKQVLLPL
jgi:hypothetical protein